MGIRAQTTDLSTDTNGDSRKNKLIPMGIRAKKTVAESAATNDFLEMRPTNPHTSAFRRAKNCTKTADVSQKNTPPSMHPHTSALRRAKNCTQTTDLSQKNTLPSMPLHFDKLTLHLDKLTLHFYNRLQQITTRYNLKVKFSGENNLVLRAIKGGWFHLDR